MYADGWSCNHARAGVGAALLRVLGTCQVVLVDVAPGAFGRVRPFNGRTQKIALKDCSVLLPREPLYVPPFGESVQCFR